MPIVELVEAAATVSDHTVAPVIAAIRERLAAMDEIGLGYLSLDRASPSLSGGEAQRVKIVRFLGSALSDVSYVFDEPSAGLHPHDVHRLLRLLRRLRDAHNTVLVVEHHPDVITAADHVIDLGPAAGADGGRVQYEGPPGGLPQSETATGRTVGTALRLNSRPRDHERTVRISRASAHNLRGVTVDVPLAVLTAVSGVAGSGKSSLFAGELPRQHPEFVVITQGPLRGGGRSNPATVLDIADGIRRVFSAATGLDPSWFSANARGACPTCKGKGAIVTDLAFLDDVRTPCEACVGSRFGATTLAATLDGRTIADVLAMTAGEAAPLFTAHAEIRDRLAWLDEVGLGYLSIGRSLDTLSGGERQRLQLARQLAETSEPESLHIVLDEPTAGLHGSDIDTLLSLFDRLVVGGATIIAIEHSQRVIAHADHVIDVGPGAGSRGGTIVYEGPPSGLVDATDSLTGRHLRPALERPPR
jgi:excinuclease UvrABC ATPase subunit